MKIRMLLPALAAAAFAATPAQAIMVAGWDFSQYVADGLLSTDFDINPQTSLPANYSHLDPTFNAGAESAAFGEFYYDGQFGSTNVQVELSATEALIPVTGSLQSNLTAPVSPPDFLNQFDSATILIDEGQNFAGELRMAFQGPPTSVVFQATLDTLPLTVGDGWSISFGGQNRGLDVTPSALTIEFSPDGINYAPVGQVMTDANDTPFDTATLFGTIPALSSNAFFRLTASGDFTGNTPTIDNVAIFATGLTVIPEPGTALLLLTGLAGLAAQGRRRA